jgi:hypothetical protein
MPSKKTAVKDNQETPKPRAPRKSRAKKVPSVEELVVQKDTNQRKAKNARKRARKTWRATKGHQVGCVRG